MTMFIKVITQFCRIFVGALFIFSGGVKLIDPVGTQIKMEEYFEVFAQAFHPAFEHFVPLALPIAVFMCVAEVVLGVALLLFYRMRITTWMLLLIMIFFTFLTGYTALGLHAKENPETQFALRFAQFAGVPTPSDINAVSDCGCFGDFIKLRPWQSFLKDIVLLFPVLFLFVRNRKLESEFKDSVGHLFVSLSLIASLWVAMDAIWHLPRIDFRPYKIGADIPANMKPTEPLRFLYTMERNGEKKEFSEYPTDTTWKYVSMDIANPEAKPKITDYSVWNDDGDFTQQSFQGAKLFLVVRKADKVDPKSLSKIVQLIKNLKKLDGHTIDCSIMTSSDRESLEQLRHEAQIPIPYYYADGTVLKTIMRSNIGLWLLKDGVVKGKWHGNDCPELHDLLELVK
jgi:uncharacterized membrane protein YphA (DoxX/SURF4 family)